jgi:hypothetical protein
MITGHFCDKLMWLKEDRECNGRLYYGQMTATDFEKLGVKKLMARLSRYSVIVLDDASYHYVQSDKPSSSYAVKADMIS